MRMQEVCCEPVSGAGAAISLLNREKTGNFPVKAYPFGSG